MKRFEGAGDILQYDEVIAHARYDLIDIVQRSNIGLENIELLSNIEGFVTILTGSIESGDTYLLRVENGKVVKMLIYNCISTGRLHPIYKVRVLGNLE